MRRRITTASRGYGSVHQILRARLAPAVAAGTEVCTRCAEAILPGQAWDLDHNEDRTGYLGPAHASCNRAAGARKRNARFGRRSRRW